MRGYSVIALDHPNDSVNVGSAARACGCFGSKLLVVASDHKIKMPAPSDTTKWCKHSPVIVVPDVFEALPHDCVPVAVELLEYATMLWDYVHPERAFYIFGAENATRGKRSGRGRNHEQKWI